MWGCDYFKERETGELTMQNDMRDRLVEIIEQSGMLEGKIRSGIVADELIANGVIVPLLKRGIGGRGMKTCKDCPHFNVCESFGVFMPKIMESTFDQARLDLINSKWKNCKFRNDKSRIIELPCKVGDTFYAIVNGQIIAYNCVGFKYGHSAFTGKDNELLLLSVYDMEFVFGEEAFLSNEEAEEKLKELNNGR